jgi:hypothetical protein
VPNEDSVGGAGVYRRVEVTVTGPEDVWLLVRGFVGGAPRFTELVKLPTHESDLDEPRQTVHYVTVPVSTNVEISVIRGAGANGSILPNIAAGNYELIPSGGAITRRINMIVPSN